MTILRVRVNGDGTLNLPVDGVVAGLNPVVDQLVDRIGLLPRKRPPAAVPKSIGAVAAGAPTANRQLSSVDARLLGFALRETTGVAAAAIELRAGTDPTGDLIVPLNLAGGETAREWFGPNGITFAGGLFLVRVTGTIDGAVYLGEI